MRRTLYLLLSASFAQAALLMIAPDRAYGADLDYNNVVIVLDASGSMDEHMSGTSTKKMDAAKTALQEVLKQVPADTRIGLLVFSSSNLPDDWAYPLGPRADAGLMEAIAAPRPGGRTPLGAYIKKGADRLLAERERQHGYGSYRLLIVTDGEAQDVNLVDRFVPEVIGRGITIDVIGVDMKTSHTLATHVHSYRRADDPASLRKAVAEVFAEVADSGSDTVGGDAFAQLDPIPDEMATAMLNSLSISGNEPIGGKVRPDVYPETGKTPARSGTGKRRGLPAPIILLIILVVILLFFRKVFRRR